MAVAVSEPIAEVVSTSNNTTYAFGSFTPTASSLLVVLAFMRGTTGTGSIANTSGTSLTWNLQTTLAWNSNADRAYLHWAKVPGSTAASVYTVSGGGTGTGCIAYMFQVTGHNGNLAVPLRQTASNTTTSTNPTVTFGQPLNTNNAYVAGWAGALSSSNPANVSTQPTSWTEIGDAGFGTPTTNATAAFRAGGETTATITFTASSTLWALLAAEVYEASQGPAPPPIQRPWRRPRRTPSIY